MDRPRCTTDRIHDVCAQFAWNWRVDDAELYARVEAALPRWPTFDQIADRVEAEGLFGQDDDPEQVEEPTDPEPEPTEPEPGA